MHQPSLFPQSEPGFSSETSDQPEFAFYYPGPVWRNSDWIKNLVLFFDGVALLVPSYIRDKPFRLDPSTTAGLEEYGLLKIIEPETFIDKRATENLAAQLTDIITSGCLDDLATKPTQFHEISYSRLGGMADAGLASMIYDELKQRGLARPTEDGLSIPMHPMVRSLILVLLAQILRPVGREHGFDLWPTTDREDVHKGLGELLSLPIMASASHVVSLDLETVGIDLSAVPIQDILEFRAEYREDYRSYTRQLRQFIYDAGRLTSADDANILKHRQNEISFAARSLRANTIRTWGRRAAFGLSLAGAVWTIGTQDRLSGLFTATSAIAGLATTTPVEASAYSYLFSARQRFG